MTGPRRREDFDVLIQLCAVHPVMKHAAEISEIDNRLAMTQTLLEKFLVEQEEFAAS
jgi:hypothetical protein